MKKIATLLFLSLLAFQSRADNADTLSIVSYNLMVFKNNPAYPDGNYRVVAKVLQSLRPDVVALQELDSTAVRTKKVYQLKRLSKFTGWNYRYASTIPFQGGSYGIGITSPHSIIRSSSYYLTSGRERRAFLIAEFAKYVVVCTHLDLDTAISKVQAREITDKVRSLYGSSPKPVFLAGDLNSTPGSATMAAFREDWVTLSSPLPSFPADAPNTCIDYILMLNKGDTCEVLLSEVVNDSDVGNMAVESDHRPIKVKVVIR
ncbi:MAG: endonuclease/exonuclease/phosphatase family protein [Dysgonamonadaceae bacterium]|nr:endonuclease/exonuclease/phosphatase family protein [Dysgonamonadaceae bacterium]